MVPAAALGLRLIAGELQRHWLLVPQRAEPARDLVAQAWAHAGLGPVARLDRFWEPPELPPAAEVALYGSDTFCLVVAQKLGLELVSPPDDLLLHAGPDLLRRAVRGLTLAEALLGPWPSFVKPLVPKSFRAGVWRSADELSAETKGMERLSPVLASEVVSIQAEARAWLLDGCVRTLAVYEGRGDLASGRSFVEECARRLPLPETCVLDVALLGGGRWALLEANAAWGAGLNGCEASEAIPCIARATRPAHKP